MEMADIIRKLYHLNNIGIIKVNEQIDKLLELSDYTEIDKEQEELLLFDITHINESMKNRIEVTRAKNDMVYTYRQELGEIESIPFPVKQKDILRVIRDTTESPFVALGKAFIWGSIQSSKNT